MVGRHRGNVLTPLPTEADHSAKAGLGCSIPPEINAHKAPATPQPPGPCFMTIYQINCHEREIKSCRDPLSINSLQSDLRTSVGEMEYFTIVHAFLKFSKKLCIPIIFELYLLSGYFCILGVPGKS